MCRITVFTFLCFLGCESAQHGTESPYDDELRAIARSYVDYGRVDDMNRWVPTLCSIQPGKGRISDTGPHGGKLFYLYARDRASYVDPQRKTSPVGQVIVKEAWVPEPADRGVDPFQTPPLASKDGKLFRPKEKAGLYIMLKRDPENSPDTDQGWIYATLDAEGKTVHQAGRIRRCMGCHEKDTVDRLFGPDS